MQKLLPGAAVLTRSDFSQLRHDGIAALVALNPAGGNRRRVFDEGQESERWVIFPQHHLKDCSDGEYRFRLILGGVESDPVTVEIRDGKRSTDTLEFRMPVKKTDLKR